jgi:hypothetical protein
MIWAITTSVLPLGDMNSLSSIPNPFRSAIVSDPWQWDVVDVPEIHNEAFDLCRQGLDHVRLHRQSTSILLYGEAGSGKTHLLARLQAYLAGLLTDYGAAPPAVFISVRLQTSPQMIWRHLRNRFGEDMLRPTLDGRSQLERIILARFATICPEIESPRSWLERLQRDARSSLQAVEEMEEALDRLDRQSRLNDRDLLVVLGHLLLARHRRDARAWLLGDSLSEAALGKLGVNPEQDDEPEERARRLVLSLTRLTGPEVPIVFCFDQVEALQSHPQDLAGLYKFGQMIGFLRDETRNSLLISCILSQFLLTLNQAIISSDRDRLALFGERSLNPLTPVDARRLVEARLDSAPELQELRAGRNNRLWPFSESEISDAVRLKKNTPRALLSYCAEIFESSWRPERLEPPIPVADFLAQKVEERLEQSLATAAPDQTDQVVTHALPLLLRLKDPRWELKAIASVCDADLVFEGPHGRISISLCNQRNMTSLAGRLRRLREQMREEVLEKSTFEKFVMLRDARLPVGAHARKTREHREQLLGHGFHWVAAIPEMIAALDTLRGLLSDARAGDLANGGESVGLATVQQWLAANLETKFPQLCDLLDEILPEAKSREEGFSGEDFELCEDLGELLQNHYLVSVADAACRLDRHESIIEEAARRYPERFGLLNGPPALLFQLTLQHQENNQEVV